MNGLDQLLHLRALRERRAAREAALARTRVEAARERQAMAEAAIDRHDADAARREARLHDAMIASGFDMADLRHASDRAMHHAAQRDTLANAASAATADLHDAGLQSDHAARTLRRAMLDHEKLHSGATEIHAAAERHLAARTEDEADDTAMMTGRLQA